MRHSSKRLPRDTNQRAKAIADLSVAEPADAVKAYLSAIGKQGGLKGGKARAKKLPHEERSRIARMGGLARGENHRKKIIAKQNSSQEN